MLSDLYSPIIGGAERHVESLSMELIKRGHLVTVCTIGSPGLSRYEEKNGIKVHRLEGIFQKIPFLFKDPTRKWHPPIQDWLITRQLRRILEVEKPDIVHAHGRIVYSILPLKTEFGFPLVVTIHSYWPLCPKTTLMKRDTVCDKPFTNDCISCSKGFYSPAKSLFAYWGTKVNKDKLKLVDKFIAVSSFVKEVHLRHLGLSKEDVVVIPNFYNLNIDKKFDISGNLPRDFILFVGLLSPVKGVDVLIEAYRGLSTKTKLVLIGNTHPDYHYCSMENILVIKNASHSLVMEAMSRCKFIVLPSIWAEPFGLTVIEAMSQKKAVIASAIGGFKDIVVNGESGILVPANNSHKLAEAISYLLQRPQLALEMGQRGYERFIKCYASNVVVPMIINVYKNLLKCL